MTTSRTAPTIHAQLPTARTALSRAGNQDGTAMGAMFAIIGYSLPASAAHASKLNKAQVIDTLTNLLPHGLAGPEAPPDATQSPF